MATKALVRQVPKAVAPAPQPSLIAVMAAKAGLDPQKYWATLRATVMKVGTDEECAAFLSVANHYELNPLTREIFAFPAKGGGIVPVVSVDGWISLINRQPAMDGSVFDDEIDDQGNVIAITCRIYRKDRSHPTEVTEYLVECRRATDTWKQWPRRMLRHKALIQAARIAFGLAGIYDEDEAHRMNGAIPLNAAPAALPSVPSAPKEAADVQEGQAAASREAIEAPPPGPAPAKDKSEGAQPRAGQADRASSGEVLAEFKQLIAQAKSEKVLDRIWEAWDGKIPDGEESLFFGAIEGRRAALRS